MLIHFEDQDYQFEFTFDLSQSRHIKRVTGLTPRKLIEGLREIDPDAVAAVYFLMKAQNGVAVDMNKINFDVMKFTTAYADAEAREKQENGEDPTKQPETGSTSTG